MGKYSKLAAVSGALLPAIMAGAQTPQSDNVNATSPYSKTNVQAQIRLNVDKDTEKVHFIRDNTDPYVITKAYVLKNADAFEARAPMQTLVQTKKVSQNNTDTDSIKYEDGTSVLLVSAEDDRFGPQGNGMNIDEIVNAFDKPQFKASSGSSRYLYFPKYRNANELKSLLTNVGMTKPNDPTELLGGKDVIEIDNDLNALFIFTPIFSKKNIDSMLKFYDNPVIQATVTYTVYEVFAENDARIGDDFQSWRNAEGGDLFSIGGRYRNNWAQTIDGGVLPKGGSNKTQFFNFNPKWSSRYIDFLVSKSKAQVLNSGKVVVRNNTTTVVSKSTGVFYDQCTPVADRKLTQTLSIKGKKISSIVADGNADYYIVVKDTNGTPITIKGDLFTGDLGVVRIQPSGAAAPWYSVTIQGSSFIKDTVNLGYQTEAYTLKVYQKTINWDSTHTTSWNTWGEVAFIDDISIEKGPKIDTLPSTAFGFNMTITPKVFNQAAILTISSSNSSLIGWKSDGSPRISKANQVNAEVVLSTDGAQFVIGGIEKREVVRSVSGIPYLRKIPVLGWIFGTESESGKRSQLVVVAQCKLDDYDKAIKKTVEARARQLDADLKGSGKSALKWGFDQYLLDDKDEASKTAAGSTVAAAGAAQDPDAPPKYARPAADGQVPVETVAPEKK
jgi:type II secretory pathway component GspD/PulD (secretin)